VPAQLQADSLHVAVDLLILTVRGGQLKLFISRRPSPPYAGCWALPGRFVGMDESAETAANKLLEEMLPGNRAFLEQLYTFTDVNRDPRGRVISVAYLAVIPWGRLQAGNKQKQEIGHWFRIIKKERELRLTNDSGMELIPGDLAFDHGRIIDTGITRIRGKIDYTDIGFRFLENAHLFSLGELQTVYEAILDDKLDSSNFRRAILNRYEKTGRLNQTDQTEKQGRGRPAALYSIKL